MIVDKIDRFLKITQEKNGIRDFDKDRKKEEHNYYHEANTGLCISLWKDFTKSVKFKLDAKK